MNEFIKSYSNKNDKKGKNIPLKGNSNSNNKISIDSTITENSVSSKNNYYNDNNTINSDNDFEVEPVKRRSTRVRRSKNQKNTLKQFFDTAGNENFKKKSTLQSNLFNQFNEQNPISLNEDDAISSDILNNNKKIYEMFNIGRNINSNQNTRSNNNNNNNKN